MLQEPRLIRMGVRHLLLVLLSFAALARPGEASLVPALFVLGDSTADTGNQNYITSIVKSNFPPYGIDFVPPGPTGRFGNGKLPNDFVAEFLGLPYPVNYLSPAATGSTLLTGVNLASSGSGYLDITGQLFGVVNLTTQMEHLGVVQFKISQQIGQAATQDLFNKAIFYISTGSNDFVNDYNINPVAQAQYNPAQWQQLIIDSVTANLKTLYGMGARKVFINSLGPVGCVPAQLALLGSQDGKCEENVNTPLKNFNVALQGSLADLRSEYPDYLVNYVNIYDILYSFIQNPTAHGFKYTTTACCGEGSYRGLPCANPVSDLCPDRDDYVFWDFFHPSQKSYSVLASTIIAGEFPLIFPTNLQSCV